MATSVHLYLTSNGTSVEGESTVLSLGRENSIECLSYLDGVKTARDKSTGIATGKRAYDPIVITKRIDKSSPLLAKSLCENEKVDGTFKFFRPDEETGEETHFFTVEITKGRLSSIERTSPDVLDPVESAAPPTEKVGMVFHKVTWTYEPSGAMHTDDWSGAGG